MSNHIKSFKPSDFGLISNQTVTRWLDFISLTIQELPAKQLEKDLKTYKTNPKEWEAMMEASCEAPLRGYEEMLSFMLSSGALNRNKLDNKVDAFTAIFELYANIYGKVYGKMLESYVS